MTTRTRHNPKPEDASAALTPAARIGMVRAYRVERHPAPTDLKLDANEGPAPSDAVVAAMRAVDPERMRRYPSTRDLRSHIAARFGIAEGRVLVTAGGDDALDRAMKAMLEPGREIIVPMPTFVMIPLNATLAGGTLVRIDWPEPQSADETTFPTDAVLASVTERTRLIAVVTPNNPTGCSATVEDIRRLSEGAPGALIVADLAYVEFADEDNTGALLEMENVLVVRTLSKAYGLAGLRVGYALGSERVIGWLEAAGGPYTVAGPSCAVALEAVRDEAGLARTVAQVRHERERLTAQLRGHGWRVLPSEANFILARSEKSVWLRDALAGLGIAVRDFPGNANLADALRITCPANEADFARLTHAIDAALAPEAVLLDLDGVLADVSRSYRRAIVETAAVYGVEITAQDIARAKALGNANNDWILTQRLLAQRGIDRPLAEVTERFERIYQGTDDTPGLRMTETLIGDRAMVERLRARTRLAIVTGRPRFDAQRFLEEQGIADCFEQVIALEDGPSKPDPAPVLCALERLGVQRAWMVGDTPDDMRSARSAGVVPIGIPAPNDTHEEAERTLFASGAARVLRSLDELLEVLPS